MTMTNEMLVDDLMLRARHKWPHAWFAVAVGAPATTPLNELNKDQSRRLSVLCQLVKRGRLRLAVAFPPRRYGPAILTGGAVAELEKRLRPWASLDAWWRALGVDPDRTGITEEDAERAVTWVRWARAGLVRIQDMVPS